MSGTWGDCSWGGCWHLWPYRSDEAIDSLIEAATQGDRAYLLEHISELSSSAVKRVWDLTGYDVMALLLCGQRLGGGEQHFEEENEEKEESHHLEADAARRLALAEVVCQMQPDTPLCSWRGLALAETLTLAAARFVLRSRPVDCVLTDGPVSSDFKTTACTVALICVRLPPAFVTDLFALLSARSQLEFVCTAFESGNVSLYSGAAMLACVDESIRETLWPRMATIPSLFLRMISRHATKKSQGHYADYAEVIMHVLNTYPVIAASVRKDEWLFAALFYDWIRYGSPKSWKTMFELVRDKGLEFVPIGDANAAYNDFLRMMGLGE